MRCHEAKRRLNSAAPIDSALRQHLQTCPSCARLAAADEILKQSLGSVSVDIPDPTSLVFIRTRVESRAAQVNTTKESHIMSYFRTRISAHPGLSVSLILALCLFAFVTLVPFSYTRTIGYSVSCSNVPSGTQASLGRVVKALAALGLNNSSVSMNSQNATVDLTRFTTEREAKEAAAAFASVTGYTGRPTISPVRETVSGSLYAQVREQFFDVHVDAGGKTDAEIAAEIASKLQAAGLAGAEVSVTTGAGGTRQIEVSAESKPGTSSTVKITADSIHK